MDATNRAAYGYLLRQRSLFDEAVAVLKAVKPNGYSEVKASKIQRLAMAGKSRLQVIERGQAKDVVW